MENSIHDFKTTISLQMYDWDISSQSISKKLSDFRTFYESSFMLQYNLWNKKNINHHLFKKHYSLLLSRAIHMRWRCNTAHFKYLQEVSTQTIFFPIKSRLFKLFYAQLFVIFLLYIWACQTKRLLLATGFKCNFTWKIWNV